MESTCGRCPWPRCVARSVLCHKSRFCFPTRLPTTWRLGWMRTHGQMGLDRREGQDRQKGLEGREGREWRKRPPPRQRRYGEVAPKLAFKPARAKAELEK